MGQSRAIRALRRRFNNAPSIHLIYLRLGFQKTLDYIIEAGSRQDLCSSGSSIQIIFNGNQAQQAVRRRATMLAHDVCRRQLSTTKIARCRSEPNDSSNPLGWLRQCLPGLHKAKAGERLWSPKRSSKSACTNRVFPVPERPIRRTTPRGRASTLRIRLTPSSIAKGPS